MCRIGVAPLAPEFELDKIEVFCIQKCPESLPECLSRSPQCHNGRSGSHTIPSGVGALTRYHLRLRSGWQLASGTYPTLWGPGETPRPTFRTLLDAKHFYFIQFGRRCQRRSPYPASKKVPEKRQKILPSSKHRPQSGSSS